MPLLLEAGEQVRVISRDVERACAMFGGDVETAHGDLDEPDSVAQRSTASMRVFLLVPAGPQQLTREGHVIRPAMRAGVRRVVKLSVLAADERSPVQLARWHRQAETEVAKLLGPWLHNSAPAVLHAELLRDGRQRRDPHGR